MIKNYIFDLYGTLIDVHTDEHAAGVWKKWLKWLDKEGLWHPEYIYFRRDFFELDRKKRQEAEASGIYKYPEIDIIPVYRELFDNYGNGSLDTDTLNRAAYAFRVASRDYIRLFPGVEEYIDRIHKQGGRVYILSNAQRSYTWPEIEMFGLDKMTDGQLISSDYGCMKPDASFYSALINKYNLVKAETRMHGDSYLNDVEGAEEFGIQAVHLEGENNPRIFYLNGRQTSD